MRPPFVPGALIAAAAAPADYESVAGDLYEEYNLRIASAGRACADQWYWSQALRSIPSLLSYSRARQSFAASIAMGAIVACVLFAMLVFKEVIDGAIHTVYHPAAGVGVHVWPYFPADWIDAALFGVVLGAIFAHTPFA